ncbi:hypothetical protein ACFSYE_13195 [Roseibacillus ishigakijimensis]
MRCLAYLALAGLSSGEVLQRGEWFVNEDPGEGLGEEIELSPESEEIATSITLSPSFLAGLSDGTHLFGVRFQDEEGDWGQTSYRMFRTPAPGASLQGGEWFVNEDPGRGAGTSLTASSEGQAVTLTPALLENLNDGVHLFGVRFQDEDGDWGHPTFHSFRTPAPSSILSEGEWFLDHDPGLGEGREIALEEGVSRHESTLAITGEDWEALAPGVHVFALRYRDSVGQWSQVSSHLFGKIASAVNLARLEWRLFRGGELLSNGEVSSQGNPTELSTLVRLLPDSLQPADDLLLEIRAVGDNGAVGQRAYLEIEVLAYEEVFAHRYFTVEEQGNPDLSGPGADPDQDGRSNLYEMALGTDPRVADVSKGQLQLQGGQGAGLSLQFSTPTALTVDLQANELRLPGTGVRYRLFVSDNLENWELLPLSAEVVSQLEGEEGATAVPLVPKSEGPAFLRLEVVEETE